MFASDGRAQCPFGYTGPIVVHETLPGGCTVDVGFCYVRAPIVPPPIVATSSIYICSVTKTGATPGPCDALTNDQLIKLSADAVSKDPTIMCGLDLIMSCDTGADHINHLEINLMQCWKMECDCHCTLLAGVPCPPRYHLTLVPCPDETAYCIHGFAACCDYSDPLHPFVSLVPLGTSTYGDILCAPPSPTVPWTWTSNDWDCHLINACE